MLVVMDDLPCLMTDDRMDPVPVYWTDIASPYTHTRTNPRPQRNGILLRSQRTCSAHIDESIALSGGTLSGSSCICELDRRPSAAFSIFSIAVPTSCGCA